MHYLTEYCALQSEWEKIKVLLIGLEIHRHDETTPSSAALEAQFEIINVICLIKSNQTRINNRILFMAVTDKMQILSKQ
jgi:hypothetical protein